jgi:hypothetical protein
MMWFASFRYSSQEPLFLYETVIAGGGTSDRHVGIRGISRPVHAQAAVDKVVVVEPGRRLVRREFGSH